ncbi:MAG: hypothetical protein J6R00_06140, partial [Lentisphaeria bacterium]|nr:hypothetical protein [Lentisphaeria bacterium]
FPIWGDDAKESGKTSYLLLPALTVSGAFYFKLNRQTYSTCNTSAYHQKKIPSLLLHLNCPIVTPAV